MMKGRFAGGEGSEMLERWLSTFRSTCAAFPKLVPSSSTAIEGLLHLFTDIEEVGLMVIWRWRATASSELDQSLS